MELLKEQEVGRLASLARQGDIAARNRLVESFMPMVRGIARKLSGYSIGLDDAIQEGAMALVVAVDGCDPSMAGSFPAYASERIRGMIINRGMAYARVVPKSWANGRESLDKDDERLAVGRSQLEEMEGREELGLALSAISRLPDRDRELMIRHLGLSGFAPESLSSIGRRTGVSPATMRKRMRDARSRLRAEMSRPASDAAPGIEIDGVTLTLGEWAKRSGVNVSTIRSRRSKWGWSWREAIMTPVTGRGRRPKAKKLAS